MLKDAGFKEVIAEERTDRVSIKSHRFQSLYIILVIWVITNLVFMYHYSFWMCCKGNWMLSRRTKTPSLKSSPKFVVFSFTTYFLCFSFFFFHASYYAYRVIRMTTLKLSMVGRRSLREVQLVSRGGDCLLPRNDESIILKLSMVGRRNSREVQLVSRGWDCLLPRNDESIVS